MKKVLCAVLAAALACGLCGCGKKEESSAQTGTPQSEPNRVMQIASQPATTETSVNETPTGSFDWDKALSELYIGDVKIEYPFSESSLGSDFIFDDEPIYNEFGDYLTIVVDHKDCRGLWFFEARYKGVTKETYTPDLVPDRIYSLYHPSVQGIKEKTSKEDVYALWGEPDEYEEMNHFNSAVYYGKKEGQKLYIDFDKTKDRVELIEIDFTDMKRTEEDN